MTGGPVSACGDSGWRDAALKPPYRHGLQILLVLALLLLVVQGFGNLGAVNDFSVYYRAAHAVRNGQCAYDGEIPGWALPYVYPPVLSAILTPLSYLPEGAAFAVWTVVNLASLIGCLFVVRRLLFFHPDPVPLVIGSLFLAFPFFAAAFRSGQVDLILFWLMLLALSPGEGERPVRSGLAMGSAIAIKLYPAGAMLGWLVGRKWKRIAAVAAISVVISLLVPAVFLGPQQATQEIGRFWTEVTPQLAGWKEAPAWYGFRSHHAYALPSAMYRWFSAESAGSLRPETAPVQILALDAGPFWLITGVAAAFWLLLAVIGLWKVERAGKGQYPPKRLLQAALVMGLIPILGPVSLKPSFITLLPVYAALFAAPAATPVLQRISWGLAAIAVTLHLFPSREILGWDFAHWLEGHSDVLVGAMLLFLALWLRTIGLGRAGPRPLSPGSRAESPRPAASGAT